MNLADQQCIPCRGGVPPLSSDRANQLLAELADGWQLNDAGHLSREFKFKNFVEALAFANRIGDIAEEQAHHPDLYVAWGRCRVEIWTHKIDGLTESDFYLAAKVSRASGER
ncbi:MAG TPA: 4a-hydroxytetrahydrobiopterin dehydratase [Gammaproteobacteria bacterium]|nr:4a-hydroxytetrahydrobiopterin dehydratase [Gammaproteobacteria bacterium]